MVLKIHKSVFQIYQLGDITSEYIAIKDLLLNNSTGNEALQKFALGVFKKKTVADYESNKNETQFINWKLLSKL